MIRTTGLSIGYKKGKTVNAVQANLNLNTEEDRLVAILGPNGCGKSTLLRTLAGLLSPLEGMVHIRDKPLHTLTLEERSRQMSLVLTETVKVVYMTVYDLVAMGRHPYTTLFGQLSDHDKACVEKALETVNMSTFRHRYIQELSDGEQQRVMIAKALAQDTPLILLDEPTSHLDLPNRIETILLLRELADTRGKTVLLSTHEIDLALRLADTIWLMEPGGGVMAGTPAEMMNSGCIQTVFHSENFGFEAETGRVIIF